MATTRPSTSRTPAKSARAATPRRRASAGRTASTPPALVADSAPSAGAPAEQPIAPAATTPDLDTALSEAYRTIDHSFRGQLGQLTGGISPIQTSLVYLDWLAHLCAAPGKQLELLHAAALDAEAVTQNLFGAAGQNAQPTAELPRANVQRNGYPVDKRFADAAWANWPYNLYAQGFLALERAWDRATHGVPGVSPKTEAVASFAARQWLDTLAPSNIPWLNPEVLQQTIREGGQNLLRGVYNWADDAQRQTRGLPPAGVEAFKVGENVAVTPGKVVFQNELMELIQYSPATEQVHAEPVLIVPAWIMKYYILDLSPHNSLVKYLVDNGHTVFMISWKNPTSIDRDRGMDDYRRLGVMAAIDTVSAIVPDRKIHAAGYCLGGTMLMIAAATMGRERDQRLASFSLFAAQGDFTEAGELLLFINESEVALIEDMMWEEGTLKGNQMAGTFQLLHSNDLIWSRVLQEYLLGRRDPPNDLMAWNADTTRMPYRMHSEYLHKLFLHNDLASGRYEVNGAPIWFTDIHLPCFAVGTETDHVAPWKSVYKLHLLPIDMTFVLTSGGHNAGIVSEPGHPHRHFKIDHRPADQPYVAPQLWRQRAPQFDGSWWPAWHAWLAAQSSGLVAPPRMGLPGTGKLPDAPGRYVLEK